MIDFTLVIIIALGSVIGAVIGLALAFSPFLYQLYRGRNIDGLDTDLRVRAISGNGKPNAAVIAIFNRYHFIVVNEALLEMGRPTVESVIQHEIGHLTLGHLGFVKNLHRTFSRSYRESCEIAADAFVTNASHILKVLDHHDPKKVGLTRILILENRSGLLYRCGCGEELRLDWFFGVIPEGWVSGTLCEACSLRRETAVIDCDGIGPDEVYPDYVWKPVWVDKNDLPF